MPRRAWLLFLPLCWSCDLAARGDEHGARPLGSPAAGSHRDPGTLVVGRPADAVSLDPARVSDGESAEACEQIYETLVTYDPETRRIRPGLAESWHMSSDGRQWTFQLRPGVRFHDGTPLDAAAVVFSLERQRDRTHPFHADDRTKLSFVYWENLFKNVRRVDAVGPLSVRITIDRMYSPFETDMAMFPVAIVSPTAVARWGAEYYRHPVGTGPFRFVNWERGRIVLERNPDYWGPRPAISRLVFRAIADGRQRLTELESAAIDVAYSIPPDQLQFVELLPDLVVYEEPSLSVAYLAMNTTHKPFNDVRVRRAVNHAVNRDPIVKLVYQGLATPATGPLPPEQWGYHKASVTYPYDPARARELLAEAAADGHFDPSRVHRLYAPSTPRAYMPEPEVIARVLQSNLAAVGLKVELIIQDKDRHGETTERGDHDLCLFGWTSDNGDPHNFLYLLFDMESTKPGVAQNLAFYKDVEVHHLLVGAQLTTSRARREALYRRAQERIALDAPWVPLAHSRLAVAARVDVGGISVNPTTGVDFKKVWRSGQ
ncbi:MAG TPA: ABC transporter substrate-binding protein [Kofleriaceae bacterium]|nr:ABC transporter substrate-binding protein [Kofleriaceae bacterium]